jgi:hypothetical protein
MPTFRCPKHDVLFEAQTPPLHVGHGKCPHCNGSANKAKGEGEAAEADRQPTLTVGKD